MLHNLTIPPTDNDRFLCYQVYNVSFEVFIVTLQSIFYSVEDVTTFARKKLTKLNIGTCIAQNEVGGRWVVKL